jgi:hypothetical protein
MSTPSNPAGVTQDKERVARPTLVWVICAFYALGAVGMALSFVRLYTGGLPLTPAQAHYFQSLSTFDVVASLTIQLIHVTAVVLLFLMRKQAAYLFPAGLVIGLVLTGFHAVTKGWVAAMGGSRPSWHAHRMGRRHRRVSVRMAPLTAPHAAVKRVRIC